MTSEEFAKSIEKEVADRVTGFCADHTHLKSHIRDVSSVVSEYNGRQIFEMLQNVDDQMPDDSAMSEDDRVCQIVLNRDTKRLCFRNKGEPFSADDIKSIMYPHASSKDSKTIGNKGLGFRSLLNWEPEAIVIRSAGLVFKFSKEIVDDVVQGNTSLNALEDASKLSMLTFPKLPLARWDGEGEWATEIELVGVDFTKTFGNPAKSIEDELKEFNPELMLFLPHLCRVEIGETENGVSRWTVYQSTPWAHVPNCDASDSTASIDERIVKKFVDSQTEPEFTTRWIAYRGKGEFGEDLVVEDGESRAYNYAIAVPCDSSKQNMFQTLYNFLPLRNVEVKLPCLVHATVKLDNKRDHLITHDANERLFNCILPEAFRDFAEILKAHPDIIANRWLPYALLSPLSGKNSRDGYVGALYERLRSIMASGEFFPCVDGIYRSMKQCCYYAKHNDDGCDITDFFNKHTGLLPQYLLNGVPEEVPSLPCDPKDLVKNVNRELSANCGSFTENELAELAFVMWRISKRAYAVLFDEKDKALPGIWLFKDKNGKLLDDKCDNVYTPASKDILSFPEYMQADFIATGNWEAITKRFEDVIAGCKNDPGNPVRGFCNAELRRIADFEYYDRYAAAKKIIESSVDLLKVDSGTSLESRRLIVHQLLNALWENYRQDREPGRQKERVPLLIDDSGIVRYADEFLFAEAKGLYGTTIEDWVFLTDQKIGEVLGNAVDDPKPFLRYLGVRSDVRISTKEINVDDGYFGFLEKVGEKEGGLPERFGSGSPLSGKLQVHYLLDGERIRRMPLETFLKLLEMRGEDGLVYWLGEGKKEMSFKWKKKGGREEDLQVKWSYVAYQLRGLLSKVIFAENDAVLSRLGWRNAQIRNLVSAEVLARLGAKQKLSDLTPAELYDLLKTVADGNIPLTRDFYKKVNAAFVAHEDRGETVPNPPAGLRVYATCNGQNGYYAAGEVHYHDNPSHSSVLLKECKMLFLGSRVGVDKVCRHFGTKKLEDSKVKIVNKNLVDKVFQEEFNLDYHRKEVGLSVVLCGRREATPDQCKQLLSRVSIILVSSLSYSYDGGAERNLEPSEYLKDPSLDGVFYVCVGDVRSFPALHIGQKESRPFCHTIAAVLCDVVKSLSEELEKEFFECYYDFEEKSSTLKEGGYWLEVADLPLAPYNYYRDHLCGLQNAFGIVTEQYLKPMLWDWLNSKKELQGFYRKYVECYCKCVSNALSDGGALADFCAQKEQVSLDYQAYMDCLLQFLKTSTCCNEAPLVNPGFSWDLTAARTDWTEPDPEVLYPAVYSQVSESDDPESLSLLYFTGNDQEIAERLQAAASAIPVTADAAVEAEELPLLQKVTTSVVFSKPIEPTVSIGDVDLGSRGTGQADNEKKSARKKANGDSAEKLVEHWLKTDPDNVRRITNVVRVSGSSRSSTRSDRLHHDITYIEGEDQYQVEVKACDSGEFFISAGELNFARLHHKTYRLALVNLATKQIEMVDDVFAKLEGKVLPVNWKVSIAPKVGNNGQEDSMVGSNEEGVTE